MVLVPGLGLFGIGRTAKDADMAADLAENTVRVVTDAEGIGRYEPLPESDLFELEYWSLEQAKLKGAVVKPLTGQVALVTGAGAIGTATAKALAAGRRRGCDPRHRRVACREGGEAYQGPRFQMQRDQAGRSCRRLAKTSRAFRRRRYRGVECRRSLAGPHWQYADELLRQKLELNFFAHQTVAKEAVRIMLKQGTGGGPAVRSSPAGGEPGRQFRALRPAQGRRHAVHAPIRARLRQGRHPLEQRADADRVRSGLLTDAMITERAKGEGACQRPTLWAAICWGAKCFTEDVAQSFVVPGQVVQTTGHIETVDGGNMAAALR